MYDSVSLENKWTELIELIFRQWRLFANFKRKSLIVDLN